MKREWLIKLRQDLKLTQDELAKRAGIARSSLAHYESGDRDPSVKVAKSLASVLDCSWSLFF